MIRRDFSGFDATLNTPGAMLEYAAALDSKMQILAQDITESSVNETFKMNWAVFKRGWDDYYAGLQSVGGWFDRLWASTLDQIDSYQNQLVEWQSRFQSYGGTVAGPLVKAAPKDASLTDLLGTVKWVAIGGAVIYGLTVFGGPIKKMLGGKR